MLDVYNYANLDGVNGEKPTNTTRSCVRVPNVTNPSKLLVVPVFYLTLAGDYPVLRRTETDNYEWAIVSGGQPVQYHDGCNKTKGSYGAGFWYFSRVKFQLKPYKR